MGRFTPAWASGLLAASVLLGLAFVSVTPAEQPKRAPRPAAARPAPMAKLVRAQVASSPIDSSAAVRAAVATHATRRTYCPAGLIALTFDDGPNPAVTPKLVRTLLKLKVPAAFFMIGSHVDAHPAVAQLVQRSGFLIGNHTWNHPMLTHLTGAQIRHQLLATKSAFKRHGITIHRLMRPPYGDINLRVRRVIHGLGMIPVLWTIDSRDWAGGGPYTIAQRILDALRPHRTNLVLQHDGVDNSPASLAAVPIVVRVARERGYCFTHLNANGGVGDLTAPRVARLIVPVSTTTRTRSTTTTRAAAPATLELTASRQTVRRLFFASSAAMRMPRSAYLHSLISKLPVRRR